MMVLYTDLGTPGRTLFFAFGQADTCLFQAKSLSTVRVTNVLASSFVTSPTIKQLFT